MLLVAGLLRYFAIGSGLSEVGGTLVGKNGNGLHAETNRDIERMKNREQVGDGDAE